METTEQTVVKKKTLWCPRCQHGPAHRGGTDKFSAGDNCPDCVEMAAHGKISENDISVLWDGAEHAAHKIKMGQLKKLEREKKAIKAQKTMDDVKREVRSEFQAKLDAQAQELADMRKLISSKNEPLKPAQTDPTPVQIVKTKSEPAVKAETKPEPALKDKKKVAWTRAR